MHHTSLTQQTRDRLRSPDNVIIFTYALAGLGHLRVTDALYHGLPLGSHPLALGAQDTSITVLHRATSIHPIGRALFDWAQHGIGMKLFTRAYRRTLRNNADLLYKQLKTLIDQRYSHPKHILVVATHFSLAHQLAEVKQKLAKEKNIAISLIVQITDDTPQNIWYVYGADLMVVPSIETKHDLEQYGRVERLPAVPIVVNPYPVSPYLASNCSRERFEDRITQLSPVCRRNIHVAIPVSGAAVGLRYSSDLTGYLHNENERFVFHVVSKDAPFTRSFLQSMKHRSCVFVYASGSDRQIVDAYEELYKKVTVSLEVTKPSEQAFKALVTPRHNGGSILLFTETVGRQEQDNVDFLRKHRLIPTREENDRLFSFCRQNIGFAKETDSALYAKAACFRGVRIPPTPREAARFIQWGIESSLFIHMAGCTLKKAVSKEDRDELGVDGVARFWNMVSDRFL